jgi:hypothetical protein
MVVVPLQHQLDLEESVCPYNVAECLGIFLEMGELPGLCIQRMHTAFYCIIQKKVNICEYKMNKKSK